MADRWREGNFFQKLAYGIADGVYSIFANQHLGGKGFDGYDDKMKTKLGGLVTLGGPLLSGGSAGASMADDIAKEGSTLLNASEKYVVIGKYPDYIEFAAKFKNASVLDLPNKWTHLPKQEAAKFLWKQNSSQLRGALRDGYIPYDIGYGGQFYNAEKLILSNKGLNLRGNVWIK